MKMSRVESATRITLEFYDAFNRHDVAGMVRLMSDDCIYEHNEPAFDGEKYTGKEAITRFWQDFFRESPHAVIEIEQIFGFAIRCVARWRSDRVDTAGKSRYSRGADIFRVQNDSICEQLSYIKG